MCGKILVYVVVTVLIAYEFGVYLRGNETTEVVNTSTGALQGLVEVSRGGKQFSGFWGIPYAEPPVGNLRFAPPKPVTKWSDTLLANRKGIECISREFMFDLGIIGQEDCLILNVFTPKNLTLLNNENEEEDENELFPVIVYIHGGGFLSGSSKSYKADYFMDRDVVFVTINYRVGALGFLNTGDNTIRGNMGMKDQNLALKWIQANIKNFGGNPNDVTLMGESAGAVSVHLHMLSPLSSGLFHKAIMLSGHALVPWAFREETVQQAQRFSENVNCPTIIQSEFLECIRARDVEDIVNLHGVHRNAVVDPLESFGPSIEAIVDADTFLSKPPLEILTSNEYTKVPIFTGVNEGEGLLWVARTILDIQESQRIKTYSGWSNALHNFLYIHDLSEENVKKITKFYFGIDSEDFDPLSQQINFANIFSDGVFNRGLAKLIQLHKKDTSNNKKAPMYLYYFTYQCDPSLLDMITAIPTERLFPSAFHVGYWFIREKLFKKLIFGADPPTLPPSHADELTLLFNINPLLDVGESSGDYAMSELFVEVLYEFAAKGNDLSFNGDHWNPVDSKAEPKFMRLDLPAKSEMIEMPFKARLEFWNSLNV